MSQESANVDLLKDAYAKWNSTKGGSVDQWLSIVDHAIKFGSLARGAPPVAFLTAYDGRESLRGYFDALLADWTMMHFTIDEYVAQGNAVVARGSCAWTHKRTGRSVETPKVDFWRFRDGKAIEFYEYYDTASVLAAATP
jgi:ketosteroid isomerase-like protein